MPADQVLSYRIEGDPSDALDANAKVAKSVDLVSARHQAMADNVNSAYSSMGRASNIYANMVVVHTNQVVSAHQRQIESVNKLAAAHLSFHQVLARTIELGAAAAGIGSTAYTYAASTGAVGSFAAAENTYRVGRLGYGAAASVAAGSFVPLLTSAGFVGAGMLAQSALSSTYNGALAYRQAQYQAAAANQGLNTDIFNAGSFSVPSVYALRNASQSNFGNSNFLQNALLDLSNNPNAGGALSAVGVSGGSGPVTTLQNIAKAFENITDPATRAARAAALFPNTYLELLPRLNAGLDQTLAKTKTFYSGFDEGAVTLDRFAKGVDTLGDSWRQVKTIADGLGESIARFTRVATASAVVGTGDFIGNIATRYQLAKIGLYGDAIEYSPGISRDLAAMGTSAAAALGTQAFGYGGELTANSAAQFGMAYSAGQAANYNSRNAVASRFSSTSGTAAQLQAAIAANDLLPASDPNKWSAAQRLSAYSSYARANGQAVGLFNQQQGFQVSDFLRDANQSSTYGYQDALNSSIGGVAGQMLSLQASLQRGMQRMTTDAYGNPVSSIVPLTSTQMANNQAMRALIFRQQFAAGPQWSDENPLAFSRFNTYLDSGAQAAALYGSNADIGSSNTLNRLGFQRDYALRGVTGDDQDAINQQLAIQRQFLLQSSTVQASDLERQKRQDLINAGVLTYDPVSGGVIAAANLTPGQTAMQGAIGDKYGQLGAGVNQSYTQGVLSAEQDAALKSADLVKTQNQSLFNDLQSGASKVLDALFSKSSNIFQQIGQILKKSILDALTGVLANNFAATITNAIHPGAVSMGPGGFLGSLGVANQPTFNSPLAGIAGFAGGITTGGDPSVMAARDSGIASAVGVSADIAAGGSGGGGGFGGLPIPISLAAQMATMGPMMGGVGPTGAVDLSSAQLTAGDASVASARQSAFGGMANGVPGASGGARGGNPIAGITSLSKLFTSGGSIQLAPGIASTSAGISQAVGGGVFGSIVGGAANFVASPGAATLGATIGLQGLTAKNQTVGSSAATVAGFGLAGASLGAQGFLGLGMTGGAVAGAGVGLVADGLRRGGWGGEAEDIGGGALVGFEVGGPIGAAFGAAIGAVAGGIRMLITTDIQHIKNLGQSLYHISISTQMAQQIDQIAKQNYAGSISVAMRSKPVLDLLGLYAQATGQKWGVMNQPIPYFLQQGSNGLQQMPTYVDGQAYSWQGPTPVAGGVQTTTLIPSVYGQGTVLVKGSGSSTPGGQPFTVYTGPQDSQVGSMSISLDGPATTSLLQGQVVNTAQNNPRLYAGAVQNAYNGSNSPLVAAAGQLYPTLLTQ